MGLSAPQPPQAREGHSTLCPIQVARKRKLFIRTPPPTGCGGPFYTSPDISRLKTKINSWIQFLPGQPHFLAHSSNFILRHYIHLTVRFVKM